ncbi:MAG: xanthine dehydrogenase accessory protein XdhC [Rhodoferax sp.]|nr:xanthine dehydrogenase accessory protein XdhC [Rhodoferax sp.]
MTQIREFLSRLASGPAVLVTVQAHQGSVPRSAGAWMAVFADTTVSSIGGGHLEWQAMAQARAWLGGLAEPKLQSYQLGAALGQCCGGQVQLRFEPVSTADVPALRQRFADEQSRQPVVALFGGGHVGAALVQVLARLPLQLRWFDSRDGIFAPQLPDNVWCEHSDPLQAAVATLPAQAQVLIMSFSHAEDLEVVTACLSRQRLQADLGLIGLIGSKTKWATFRHRLTARGFSAAELSHVTCPIGVPGIKGKEPEVIAVAVAAQVLQALAATQAAQRPISWVSQAV